VIKAKWGIGTNFFARNWLEIFLNGKDFPETGCFTKKEVFTFTRGS